MLHPSYSDLIRVVNSEVEEGEQPVVQSRYSIVIATAKRARQIIAGAEPLVEDAEGKNRCPSLWKSFITALLRFSVKMKKSRMKWFQQPMRRLRRKQRKPKNRKRKQWKNNLKIGQNIWKEELDEQKEESYFRYSHRSGLIAADDLCRTLCLVFPPFSAGNLCEWHRQFQ